MVVSAKRNSHLIDAEAAMEIRGLPVYSYGLKRNDYVSLSPLTFDRSWA